MGAGNRKKIKEGDDLSPTQNHEIPFEAGPVPVLSENGDSIDYCQKLLGWALQVAAYDARGDVEKMKRLIEVLPNVIRVLVAVEQARGREPNSKASLEEITKEVNERLSKIEKPKLSRGDLGEVPVKLKNGAV